MNRFIAFKNCHRGEKIIVCGCGESLNLLRKRQPECITIGVNDVGRLFNPDYLVVLNQKSQFARGRYIYVENSRAKAVFSHYRLSLNYARLVQFTLGRYAGTDTEDPYSLPYTKNSPYVAVCLAAYMGASEIGLLGVDFTDHHFFGQTGQHPLVGRLAKIDQEYHQLVESFREKNISLVNLSPTSRLISLKKISIQKFLCEKNKKSLSVSKPDSVEYGRKSAMKIQIEKHNGGLIGGFMDALAGSAEALGYAVTRVSPKPTDRPNAVKVVWNGRNCRNHKNIVYCEHGWLPREAYQVSHKGINADSHIAPFTWDNSLLPESQREQVATYLQSLRQQSKFSLEYMRTDVPVVEDLPPEFLLVPLQMENDTNIVRHVEPGLRRMQSVIDYISQTNPPYPVIYKQHPADTRRGNGQLRLRPRRGMDQIRSHARGNIHQILKSGACKGIISLNSNVVHDGFLWNVPAIVLGRNIWPQSGVSPFIIGLPRDWRELDRFYFDRRTTACRESYIHFIVTNQWTLDDAKNPDKVDALLQQNVKEIRTNNVISLAAPARQKQVLGRMINVVAKNRGWLFEDLKSHFAALRLPGIQVVSSEKPLRQADAWLFLRAGEIAESPDLSRTLVQIHDQFNDGYEPGGNRYLVRNCGAICFTHPDQERIIKAAGIELSNKQVMIKPLGATRHFQLRRSLPRTFTVAWVGRPVKHGDREIKRVAWFVEALEQLDKPESLEVLLLGDRLSDAAKEISRKGIRCNYFPRQKYSYNAYPGFYGKMDCLVITSELAAGPNCLFEALASGVPVIATPCGWVETLIRNGENGYVVSSPSDIAAAINVVQQDREAWFKRRHAIRDTLAGLSLEPWLGENVILAASLENQRVGIGKANPDIARRR